MCIVFFGFYGKIETGIALIPLYQNNYINTENPYMKKAEIETLSAQHIFRNIYGLAQKWDPPRGSWSFVGNPRRDHGFMYIRCERVVIRCGKEEKVFHRGNLLYIPIYSEYAIEFSEYRNEVSDLLVNFLLCDYLGEEYCLDNSIVCLLQETPSDIINDMSRICMHSNNMKNPYLITTKLFYELLEKLLMHRMLSDAGGNPETVIARSVFYIDSHIGDNITVNELAKMCLLSESTFRKLFHAYTGVSPAQYKIRVKIEKAKSILASTPEVSVAEVAESLGFCDVYYFHKLFTSVAGTSPAKYRNGNTEQPF